MKRNSVPRWQVNNEMAELLTSRQNRSKKGKFAKRKPKSPDDITDENNNDIVEDLEQHIQGNEGRRIVELGKLAV